jgi:hypothetical protein
MTSTSGVNSFGGLPVVSKALWFASPAGQSLTSGSGSGSAAVVDEGPLVSPMAIDLAVSSDFPSSIKATHSPVRSDSTTSVSAKTNLLLLDQILADLAAADAEAPVCDRWSQEDDNVGELELAAVFDDVSNWWSL